MLIGLVGKPSVGKSTFFKAATLAEVDIAPHPFTTIKANRGMGYVKIECIDKEFGVKCNPSHGFCVNSNRFIPIELIDVAGLVPGASEGKGLGNQFLDELRQADALIHVIDISGKTDEKGNPSDDYDVSKDIVFLEEELDRWFLGILSKVWKSFSKKAESEKKDFAGLVAKQFSGLKVSKEDIKDVLKNNDFSEKPSMWDKGQLEKFSSELRKKSKPMIIAANKIDPPGSYENFVEIKKKFPGRIIIPCSADLELALRQAAKSNLIRYIPGERDFKILEDVSEQQKKALESIKSNILDKYEYGTGVQEVLNRAVFGMLKYIVVFPASANKLRDSKGNILPDCFLMPDGSTALDFAYYLHSDFGKNFIKAIDARTKKALGKDYVLKHRDAIEIVAR